MLVSDIHAAVYGDVEGVYKLWVLGRGRSVTVHS